MPTDPDPGNPHFPPDNSPGPDQKGRPKQKHPLKAPDLAADVKVHKKHAEEFLKLAQYEDAAWMNGPEYSSKNDEAKP